MPGLFATLGNSVSAMAAQSVAINTAGNNLANVDNASYAEEVVNMGDLGDTLTSAGEESDGLVALSVTSDRNALLDSQVRSADSALSYYTTQQSAYQQAQAALGQTVGSDSTSSSTDATVSGSGIGAALDNFFNAFSSLAADPSNAGAQQTVLSNATTLTSEIQSTDSNLAQVQAAQVTQVQSSVTSTNQLLQQIATFNTQIAQVEANAPGTAVDLRDQREADLETLANTLPITVSEDSKGEDTVTVSDTQGNPVTLVSEGTVQNTLSFDARTNQVLAGTTVLGLTGGSLQGALDANSQGIQSLRDSLTSLADELVTAVNSIYNPSGNGGNFFSAGGTTAATISVDPSVTTATLQAGTGAAGDNSIATGIANLANSTFSTADGDAIDGTFDSYYAGTVSAFGQTLTNVNDHVNDQTAVQTLATNQREAVSGVNLDEEMASLMKYQRSYEASAEVFQTVDSLLDTVINSMGTITT